MESFAGGQAMGERQRLKKALATYSTNPDDPEAMSTIAELEPRLAAQLHEERLAQQFNDAAARYYGGGNALANIAGSTPPARSGGAPMNALLGVAGTEPAKATPSAFEQAFAPVANPNGQEVQPVQPREAQTAESDFSALGEPRDERDAAFLDMLRLDAKRAFEIDSEMRDRAADKLKLQMDGWG
ncbi:hypothetical protein [Pelagerythrobacter aerophilus]|uniref:Uncharacterized protein n=1 Tax=Pelagerythrobacter aerophilus TaxID=2306995 RepID=A0A418NEG7_9SPHN|nr:hypothetical protein [Pelagerythrobacter aerophilus]RIV75624.1 hypothetical protein D2V04_15130 [Pelagerythrobacter aerophilus]